MVGSRITFNSTIRDDAHEQVGYMLRWAWLSNQAKITNSTDTADPQSSFSESQDVGDVRGSYVAESGHCNDLVYGNETSVIIDDTIDALGTTVANGVLSIPPDGSFTETLALYFSDLVYNGPGNGIYDEN